MKKIIYLLMLSINITFAQYYGERTTEQSFENSSLYFNSYYLNPFGISHFKKVAPGLINNPFLNLSINPANIPDMGEKELLVYLEFRGDRTEPEIINRFYSPYYLMADRAYSSYYYDPRWLTIARSEPEPVFSLGIIAYPLKSIADDFFVGGSYQLIHKEEKFYTMPYWIYSPNYYYDALGVRAEGLASVPITDRYSGKDEMMNEGHLFSAFAGYRISDQWSAGVSLNGAIHSRDGGYLNSYKDEYGQTDNYDWENSYSQNRIQDYDHLDLSAGINFQPASHFKIGVKGGHLNGEAKQEYNTGSYYYSMYKVPFQSTNWHHYFSNSVTDQKWSHDGKTNYYSINFTRQLKNNSYFSGYYKFAKSEVDLSSTSNIVDTSYNTSRYVYNWDNNWHLYNGYSSAKDIRSSTGNKNINNHEGMLGVNWKITQVASVYFGLYFNSKKTKISTNEPVNANRFSSYSSTSSDTQYNYNNSHSLNEIKTLVWDYNSDYWSLQIPIIFNFRFSKYWGMHIGLNRILESWEISDVTTAYFVLRERLEDNQLKRETNFGERYTQPVKKKSDNSIRIFTSFDISITEALKVRLMLDPDFEYEFRIAQWWLSFETIL
jgi:hypothetical protein